MTYCSIHDQYPRDIIKPVELKNDANSMHSECNELNDLQKKSHSSLLVGCKRLILNFFWAVKFNAVNYCPRLREKELLGKGTLCDAF